MKNHLATFFAEAAPDMLRAEVFEDDNGYHGIQFYKSDTIFNEVRYPGKDLAAVSKIAEKWSVNIKIL